MKDRVIRTLGTCVTKNKLFIVWRLWSKMLKIEEEFDTFLSAFTVF